MPFFVRRLGRDARTRIPAFMTSAYVRKAHDRRHACYYAVKFN